MFYQAVKPLHLVILDAVLRLIPGVLGNKDSIKDETFENSLLEYPQFTKPKIWEGKSVPDVLFSGDHAKIKSWRLSQSEDITRRQRPDLWEKYLKEKNNEKYRRYKQRSVKKIISSKKIRIFLLEIQLKLV